MILNGDNDSDGQLNNEEFIAEMAKLRDNNSDNGEEISEDALNRGFFDYIDKDGNDYISFSEAKHAFTIAGEQKLTDDELRFFFKGSDIDGDGHLNFEEHLLIASDDGEISDEQIFSSFDKDNSGYISFSEAKHASNIIGEQKTDDEIKEELRQADIDGDGQLNFEELVASMKKQIIIK